MFRSHSFAWILVSLLSLSLAAPLQAVITPFGDLDPDLPDNLGWWTGGGDSSTQAYIGKTATGSVTVNLGSDLSSHQGFIGHGAGATGVVTVDGSGSTWTGMCYDLWVGGLGQGTLNITNGGAVSNSDGYIGWDADSAGVVTVDGSGSTWTNSINLIVGRAGTGALSITDGGTVSNLQGRVGELSGSSGEVTVSGAGSTWTNSSYLIVGRSGTGTLNVSDGGAVLNTNGYLGYSDSGSGNVTVSGAGSTWTNSGNLYIGGGASSSGGTGELTITNGGTVSNNGSGYIGYQAVTTGVVTVDGSGSTWTCDEHLYVGRYGQGTLNITNGGAVSNSTGYISRKTGSTGVVTVDGSGSTWTNSGGLYVGGYVLSSGGTGELTVSGGGSVEVGGVLKVWGGGTLNIGSAGQVSAGEALVLKQDGTLTAEAGAVIHMTGSSFENESTNSAALAGLGNLTMIFEGGTGDVDPFETAGEDVGAVIGGFVEANFLLGTLQLGGEEVGRIELVDDFDNQDDGNPGTEAVYVNNLIMNAGATIDLNDLNLYYDSGDPKQFFCGDADLDGGVDDADLSLLLASFGDTGKAWGDGDFDGDGDVDDSDLSILLVNFGSVTGPPAVPEPASACLLLLGAVALLRRRRR